MMRKLRAVVADDEEDTRTLLARAGRAAGFEVDEASSAEELLGIVEGRDGAAIDIVISDIAMPGVDGLEVVRRLHESMPSLPVILVSGYTHQGVLKAAAQAGARTVLAKPIDPVVLALVMAAHCEATHRLMRSI